MKDFFVTLPSNTISETENSTAKYATHLPQKLILQGNWEVALVEIQYPHSWNNIFGHRQNKLADNWIDVTFSNNYLTTLFVPPSYYEDIFDLLNGIEYGKQMKSIGMKKSFSEKPLNLDALLVPSENPEDMVYKPSEDIETQLIPQHALDIKNGFMLSYDQTLKRVKFKKLSDKIKYIELSERLQYMLGFEKPGILDKKQTAKFIPDLRGGFYSLFVYCNLVEPQIVGNVIAPLLRNVHIEGKHGEIVEKLFNTPHYVPVNAKEVERIEIDIRDDNNQSVPFQFGKTVVKLHFRKKYNNL